MTDKPVRFFHDLARYAAESGASAIWGGIVNRCATGEEVVFYYVASQPYVAGHINSPVAMAYYTETGVCGFHHDPRNGYGMHSRSVANG